MLYMAYFIKKALRKYTLKILYYVGSSEKDLKKLPDDTIDAFVYGLTIAQQGGKSSKAKVLQGFGGADVIELIDRDADGTYRAVYTVRMSKVIFVLHVFQKKSKHGIATPKQDIDLIKSRLKRAQEIYKESFK
jgi:phage-related protein